MNNVKIKDRKKEIEFLRMALNICELGVNYEQADLIIRINKKVEKMGGKFSLEDGIEIYHKWKHDWLEYYDPKNQRKINKTNPTPPTT